MTDSTPYNKDNELLSAYLDNQLEAKERMYLDQRLQAEPSLRVELEELRATVALCKQVEPIIPSRSFTLDPSTIQQRQPFWQRGWLRLSGGVLAMVFGIVVLTSLYGGGSPQSQSAQVAPTFQVAQDDQANIAAREAPASDGAPAPAPPQMSESPHESGGTASPAAVAVFPTQMEEGEEADMVAAESADEEMASETMTDTEYAEQPEDMEWTRPSVAAKPYTPPAVIEEEEALEARPSFVVRHSPIPEATPSPAQVAGASNTSIAERAETGATSAPTETASSPDSFPLAWVIIPILLLIVLSGVWVYLRNRKI